MKLTKIKPNTVVHCKTLDEAVELLEIAERNGYRWMSGDLLSSVHNYEAYGADSCYSFEGWADEKKVRVANTGYYKEKGVPIMEFDNIPNAKEAFALDIVSWLGEHHRDQLWTDTFGGNYDLSELWDRFGAEEIINKVAMAIEREKEDERCL